MPAVPSKPKLVNRGVAGLLNKVVRLAADVEKPVEAPAAKPAPINFIATDLREKGLVVEIATLTLDPMNARLHPERNLESIKTSLSEHGQLSTITVRKENQVIMKGNGTVTAALALGWTEIAAVFVGMSDAQAAAYGLADNRTSELAKWDFETVAKLDKLIREAGLSMVGWSMDELEVLRAADWVPPIIDDAEFDAGGGDDTNALLVSFTLDSCPKVWEAIEAVRSALGDTDRSRDACLALICADWLESKNAANTE